ncbi:DUF4336 domain-containing protein [Nioella ostreopsis]|uniref:DUF4336 domain-containing protein n=1 Tax=Nioella ostreopsis TaxID=2448479 RepID=UPI000FD74897|nr:DUF4336 domain-containing protein [Nioella ostreopsis]
MILLPFGPGLWLADGPDIRAAAGFHYPTRMAVARLADGGLLLWSPVRLTPALLEELEALGPVRHIVAPNRLHHMALADWVHFCPGVRLHAAPGLRAKRGDLHFSSDLGDHSHPDWSGQIDQVIFPNAITDEVVFFHRDSATVLFTDLLQQMPKGWYRGWRRLVAWLDLMTGAEPQVPRKFRMATRDKPAARAAVATIKAWQPTQVVVAHGTPVTDKADAFLTRAFSWLG